MSVAHELERLVRTGPDPEGALAWALTIGNAERREGALVGTLSNWARRNRQAASDWLQNAASLPAETRARLEPVVNQNPRRSPQPGPLFFPR